MEIYDFQKELLKRLQAIPFIKFPQDWEIQMNPPYAGATARFRVKKPSGKITSVYLDCYEMLGSYMGGKPYWEVYPVGGEVGRCGIDDVEELLKLIERSEGMGK